jgi:hypothetical protein
MNTVLDLVRMSAFGNRLPVDRLVGAHGRGAGTLEELERVVGVD